jgi:PAS domain S-box-containing protein
MKDLKILHLEDNRQDADLVEATLAADGLTPEITRVDSREAFQAALAGRPFDIILADYNLPSFDGIAAQELAARLRPETPFIFLSGSLGEEGAVERLKAGATDYVLKDRMARLPSAVRRALIEASVRAARREAEDSVRQLNADLEKLVAERTLELAESERRLKAILFHSPAAISLKDSAGRYLLVNREFERVAGVSADGIVGKTDADVFPPRLADVYRGNDARVLEHRHGIEIEETFLQGDGAHVHHAIKFPLLDDGGHPYALCAIAIDITERKKMDDALKMARMEADRANRAKSDFLSRMSHDLRTPLNAILGFAQLLEVEVPTENTRDSIAQILHGGKYLLVLINEVLDIARIEAGHLSLSIEPVDARETVRLVANLVRPLADQRGIRIVIDEPRTSDVFVRADRQRLNQVLMNLLSNAVKYNRVGGLVTVGFEKVDERMRITVTDTGAGLPPAKLAMLFQPFERLGAEQTSVEGTGLGLALSRGLADAMGGTLGVTSEVDRGSTFWIELALTEPAHAVVDAEPEARPADAMAPRSTTGVVLYVEDNRSNVRLMERVLQRRAGVRLLHAPSGADGVAMAREHRPDLILLDLHLPDIPGEEVLQRLSQDPELRDIPVAILSADALPAHPRRLKTASAIAYLTKPLDIRLVLQLVDETLDAPRLLARGADTDN